MDRCFALFSKLQLRYVVVVGADGRALGPLERVHLLSLDVPRLERVARSAGEFTAVKRSKTVRDLLAAEARGDAAAPSPEAAADRSAARRGKEFTLRASILGYAADVTRTVSFALDSPGIPGSPRRAARARRNSEGDAAGADADVGRPGPAPGRTRSGTWG